MRFHKICFIIAIALSGASIVTLSGPSMAQSKQPIAKCDKTCDCTFECLDFCSTTQCTTNSSCKRRVAAMEANCRRLCRTCQSFKKSS